MAQAGASILNNIASQLEVVRPVVEEISAANNDQLYGRVKSTTKAEKISRWLLRWPLETQIGGNQAKVSANGGVSGAGVLPTGTQAIQIYAQAGYFVGYLGFRLTVEQMKITDSQQAINDFAARQAAYAVVAQQSNDDVTFHQDGTGILTNASSATNGTTTLTFAASTDTLGVNMLYEGQCVSVWDATGATERAAATAAPIIITAIDYEARTVTFDQSVTTLTATDIIALRGMAIYGPSTLTSFNSTYPGTVGAAAAGIGGDSWRHGFRYWTNTTSSNYFYRLQKSSYPQLNPVRVNANNDTLQWEQGLRLIAKIKQKRPNVDAWKKLEGIAHGTQKAAAFELGMSISQKLIGGSDFGKSLDLVPNGQENSQKFTFAGIPINESTRQDRGRIDFINFDKIGRSECAPTGPYKKPDGGMFFEGRDATTGSPITFYEWWWESYYENVAWEAGAFGCIDTLALPSSQWDA